MSTPKPLIGVTASLREDGNGSCTSSAYLHALSESGALPLLLPLSLNKAECLQLAQTLDGFLFTGGPDIHPFSFHEETLDGCENISLLRDQTELLLFSVSHAQNKPILAICRGIQLINLALGGDLYQDIQKQTERTLPIAHRQPFSPSVPSHHVTISPDSLLAEITDAKRLNVNSAHHQAVRRPASSLSVCAAAPDGIIEAIEEPNYPFLIGVQWHPELLYDSCRHARALFHAFVQAAR